MVSRDTKIVLVALLLGLGYAVAVGASGWANLGTSMGFLYIVVVGPWVYLAVRPGPDHDARTAAVRAVVAAVVLALVGLLPSVLPGETVGTVSVAVGLLVFVVWFGWEARSGLRESLG